MSKNARLSRDQKRKQKLAKRDRRQPDYDIPAYTGSRYKSPVFVEPLFEAEQGIYEMYLISRRQLTDDDVQEELEELIEDLRERPVADLIYEDHTDDEGVLVVSVPVLILHHWRKLLEARKLPLRDDLIGILRTILGSLETWRSQSASSRGYLNYLDGFMKKMGVRVSVEAVEGTPLPEPPPDELYEVGEMWLAGSPEARHRFSTLAGEVLDKGDPDRVVNVCQKLMASISSPAQPEFAILSELSIRAQKTQQKATRSEFTSGLKSFISRLTGR